MTSRSVTLQWSPPTDTGGVELTGYIIEKMLVESEKWEKAATVEPSVTLFTVDNLKVGNIFHNSINGFHSDEVTFNRQSLNFRSGACTSSGWPRRTRLVRGRQPRRRRSACRRTHVSCWPIDRRIGIADTITNLIDFMLSSNFVPHFGR